MIRGIEFLIRRIDARSILKILWRINAKLAANINADPLFMFTFPWAVERTSTWSHTNNLETDPNIKT